MVRKLPLGLTVGTLLMTTPYIKWLGFGTATDVQLYPLFCAVVTLALYIRRIRRRDLVLAGFVVIALLLTIFQLALDFTNVFSTFRGLYGYFVVALMVAAWLVLLRQYGRNRVRLALMVSFWIWAIVGVIQLFAPHALTFWRDKLVITDGRGALSLATEPAYFAFALLLMSVAIIVLGGPRWYLLASLVFIVFVAQSSVGMFYALVATLLFAATRWRTRLVTLVGCLLAWVAVIFVAPSSRIANATVAFVTDPFFMVGHDKSIGLRYISLDFPVRAFLSDWGLPHGVNNWVAYRYRLFSESADQYSWPLAAPPEGNPRILGVHGQLIFELGIFSIAVYAILWLLIRKSSLKVELALLLLVIFVNGVTLNSPFLAVVLAAAYFVDEPDNPVFDTKPHGFYKKTAVSRERENAAASELFERSTVADLDRDFRVSRGIDNARPLSGRYLAGLWLDK